MQEAVRVYLAFLTAIAARQDDVKGVRLRREIQNALETVAASLPDSERGLLPGAPGWQRPERFVASIGDRTEASKIPAPSLDRVRVIYVHVFRVLISRLGAQLDDSMVRLLFRLAARDALQKTGGVASEHMLLEGDPGAHLRQTGPAREIPVKPLIAVRDGAAGFRT
ncbi:MAG: hypothetical protein FJ149_11550 [Euryarchaeota archaeon]|nr:hypothetical protein [Euryarchaeota archaeon]